MCRPKAHNDKGRAGLGFFPAARDTITEDKMKNRITTILLTAALAGCGTSPVGLDEAATSGRITFGLGIVSSRGPIESGVDGIPQQDMSEIWILRGTDGASASGFAGSAPATTASLSAGATTLVTADKQYFGDPGKDAHFMAFYPAPESFAPGRAEWTLDGSQDIMATRPAVATYNRNGSAVALRFDHLLARLDLKIIASDEGSASAYGDLAAASVTVPSRVALTIADDGTATLAKTGESDVATLQFGPLALTTEGTVTDLGLMVFPASGDLQRITLRFDNRPAESYALSGVQLRAGYKTLIVVTVTGYGIGFDISVEPWKPSQEAGNGSGEIGLGKPDD